MKDLSKDEMIQLLQTQEDGVISISDGDTPYCIPFGHVLVNDTVYISLFPKGRKWEIIQKNPKVCFNVYSWNDDHTEWSSVVVDGVLEQVNEIPEIESVVSALIVKMGLEPESYLEKRMKYYTDNLDNPKGLKVFRINSSSIGGKTMPTMMGK
jgi:nitroimidazol reductase NimA-like FMN-containing flavoprotein (pyridoxamine 5'-phosphate oxidase superfamily)